MFVILKACGCVFKVTTLEKNISSHILVLGPLKNSGYSVHCIESARLVIFHIRDVL